MQKRKRNYVLVSLSLAALILSAGFVFSTPSPRQTVGINETVRLTIDQMIYNDIGLSLRINVSDHGKVLSSTYLEHDMILNNFYKWLIALLNNAQSGERIFASVTDTAGSAQTPSTWGADNGGLHCGNAGVYCFNAVKAGQGGLIEVGTSSTAATRADTNLGTAFQSYFNTNSYCSTGATDSIIITGSVNANSGVTITESGLFFQDTTASNVVHTYILAHDIFAGVVVSAGNTITIQYTWSLNNAGFNYNLCELLAAYFTQPNGANNQVKTPAALMVFYDTLGRNVTWSPICDRATNSFYGAVYPLSSSSPTSAACTTFSSGQTNNAMQIQIGTGGVAFTPTTRKLTTYYAQNYITSTSQDGAGNAYETANILLVTGATITEAGIFLTLPRGCIGYSPLNSAGSGQCVTGYASDTIMLLAATFAGQVVPNGQSIGVTFQESG